MKIGIGETGEELVTAYTELLSLSLCIQETSSQRNVAHNFCLELGFVHSCGYTAMTKELLKFFRLGQSKLNILLRPGD